MKQFFYKIHWTDGNGGAYTRTFRTWEEREKFRPMIERKDWRGMSNVTVWEVSTDDTIR